MKRKIKVKNVIILLFIVVLIIGVLVFSLKDKKETNKNNNDQEETITDFKDMALSEVEEYANKKNFELEVTYQYSDIEKNKVISSKTLDQKIEIVVSKGAISYQEYKDKNVNELGEVPIMMYHGIVDTTENEYTGGNVDKDGYNRTSNAFLEDLEFYYEKGYRMIRLSDYVNGKIDVELGFSPIILTFDDGNANNFKVIGRNEDGSLKFDPKSAIGILESIKEKYKDFNVTATFFLNSSLCNQPEYDEEIIKWLVSNGYDVGNHTTNHANFSNIDTTKTQEVVGKMYNTLESIIPGKYVNIVALPFGSPYKKTHANYPYILNGEYDGKTYETKAALRVGWESELSPFDSSFDPTFLKRCRAYDNNGKDFDIEMNFKLLDKDRYISDGDIDTIVVPRNLESKLKETDLNVITYEEEK